MSAESGPKCGSADLRLLLDDFDAIALGRDLNKGELM
jgi:hypothetical protein